jgi:hypothetical protein
MPHRPGVFARFLGRPPRTLDWALLATLLSVVSLILVCAIYVVAPGILFRQPSATTILQESNLPTATTAITATAITATAITATPTTPPVKPPSIGAPYSAFAAALSSRLDAHTWQVQVGGQPAALDVIQQAGIDGQQRITRVGISPLPAGYGQVTYPSETAITYIEQFLPADAGDTGTKTEIDGSVTHLLHSASLAPLLPARAYLFGQPGDLFWNCFHYHIRSGIDSCVVGLA